MSLRETVMALIRAALVIFDSHSQSEDESLDGCSEARKMLANALKLLIDKGNE